MGLTKDDSLGALALVEQEDGTLKGYLNGDIYLGQFKNGQFYPIPVISLEPGDYGHSFSRGGSPRMSILKIHQEFPLFAGTWFQFIQAGMDKSCGDQYRRSSGGCR